MNDKKKEEKSQQVQKLQPAKLPTPFEPYDFFSDSGMFKEMERFFEEYLPRRWWQHFGFGHPGRMAAHSMRAFDGKAPSVDILDKEDHFLVRAELPGVDKEDIHVSIANNILTIEASMSKDQTEEKEDYCRQEICRGSYRRTIALPEAVKENEAKANFKNGVLELTVGKMEKTKRATIKVE